ncbi:MAG: hypothetical protein HQK76_01670 [Desulfobacterales bacterium]|nr:hypothetical protein [Desulfobacterales bacterium]
MKKIFKYQVIISAIIFIYITAGFAQDINYIDNKEFLAKENYLEINQDVNLFLNSDDLANVIIDNLSGDEKSRGSRAWMSSDSNDLKPIIDTKWEITYTIGTTTTKTTLTFGSSISTTSDGTVNLECSDNKGKSGFVFYMEFSSSLGGGQGFGAAIVSGSGYDFYYFKVNGSACSGYFKYTTDGSTYSSAYALKGVKTYPSTSSSDVNLTSFTPTGWSSSIVISTTTGAKSDASSFSKDDNIYLNYFFYNKGTGTTSGTFYVDVYIDGVQNPTASGKRTTPLGPYPTYIALTDISLGKLSAGSHTIKIIIDPTGAIAETNESDNEYSKTITIGGGTSNTDTLNLKFFTPQGWSDSIVVSNITGAKSDAALFSSNDDIYLNYSFYNEGPGSTSGTFYVYVYIDGVQNSAASGKRTTPLAPYPTYLEIADTPIGKLSAGNHTIKIKIDALNTITETNESDNEYAKTITIATSGTSSTTENVNLKAFQPPEWSNSIVVSNIKGATTDALSFSTEDEIYFNYALYNEGPGTTSEEFYIDVYIDGIKNSGASGKRTSPLSPYPTYTQVTDKYIGKLGPGKHKIIIRLDSNNEVNETNESDNEYFKEFDVIDSHFVEGGGGGGGGCFITNILE